MGPAVFVASAIAVAMVLFCIGCCARIKKKRALLSGVAISSKEIEELTEKIGKKRLMDLFVNQLVRGNIDAFEVQDALLRAVKLRRKELYEGKVHAVSVQSENSKAFQSTPEKYEHIWSTLGSGSYTVEGKNRGAGDDEKVHQDQKKRDKSSGDPDLGFYRGLMAADSLRRTFCQLGLQKAMALQSKGESYLKSADSITSNDAISEKVSLRGESSGEENEGRGSIMDLQDDYESVNPSEPPVQQGYLHNKEAGALNLRVPGYKRRYFRLWKISSQEALLKYYKHKSSSEEAPIGGLRLIKNMCDVRYGRDPLRAFHIISSREILVLKAKDAEERAEWILSLHKLLWDIESGYPNSSVAHSIINKIPSIKAEIDPSSDPSTVHMRILEIFNAQFGDRFVTYYKRFINLAISEEGFKVKAQWMPANVDGKQNDLVDAPSHRRIKSPHNMAQFLALSGSGRFAVPESLSNSGKFAVNLLAAHHGSRDKSKDYVTPVRHAGMFLQRVNRFKHRMREEADIITETFLAANGRRALADSKLWSRADAIQDATSPNLSFEIFELAETAAISRIGELLFTGYKSKLASVVQTWKIVNEFIRDHNEDEGIVGILLPILRKSLPSYISAMHTRPAGIKSHIKSEHAEMLTKRGWRRVKLEIKCAPANSSSGNKDPLAMPFWLFCDGEKKFNLIFAHAEPKLTDDDELCDLQVEDAKTKLIFRFNKIPTRDAWVVSLGQFMSSPHNAEQNIKEWIELFNNMIQCMKDLDSECLVRAIYEEAMTFKAKGLRLQGNYCKIMDLIVQHLMSVVQGIDRERSPPSFDERAWKFVTKNVISVIRRTIMSEIVASDAILADNPIIG